MTFSGPAGIQSNVAVKYKQGNIFKFTQACLYIAKVNMAPQSIHAGGPGFDSRWLPCDFLFLFQRLTSLCLQNWMMSTSALVQVAAISGALVQAAAIISALVQFGCYH